LGARGELKPLIKPLLGLFLNLNAPVLTFLEKKTCLAPTLAGSALYNVPCILTLPPAPLTPLYLKATETNGGACAHLQGGGGVLHVHAQQVAEDLLGLHGDLTLVHGARHPQQGAVQRW
jgi:hypothetical protein